MCWTETKSHLLPLADTPEAELHSAGIKFGFSAGLFNYAKKNVHFLMQPFDCLPF